MKKLFYPIVIAAGCFSATLVFAGCDEDSLLRNRFESYSENGYTVGAGEASNITDIEIEWVAGNVTVVALPNSSNVKFAETTGETNEQLLLHSKVQGGTLELKYAGSKAEYSGGMSKDLTVSVPSGMLSELSVENVSGTVTLEGLSARELSVETVAGDLTVSGCSFSELAFESVGGSLDLTMADVGFTLEFETLSGNLSDAFGATRNRNTYVYGDGSVQIEVETVSGNAALHKNGDSQQGGTQQGGNQGNQGGTEQGGNQGSQGGTEQGGNQGNQGGTEQGGNQGSQGGTEQGGNQGSQGGTEQGGNQGNQGGTEQGGNQGNQGGTQQGGNQGNQGGTQQGGNQGNQGGTQQGGQTPPADGERYERYDDAIYFTAGGATVRNVTEIEIDWWGGDIVVERSSAVTEVTFSETNGGEYPLYYSAKAGELEIKYAASGAYLPRNLQKTLTVTVPASLSLVSLEAEGRGNIKFEGISARDLTAETDSGEITVRDCSFLDGEFDTVSGNVLLVLEDRGFTLEFETYTGTLDNAFSTRSFGRRHIYGDGFIELSVETVSGNLTVQKGAE